MADGPPPITAPHAPGAGKNGEVVGRRQLAAGRFFPRSYLRYAILFFLAWMVCAWFLATEIIAWRTAGTLRQADRQIQQTIDDMAQSIRRSLAVFHGVPAALGRNVAVQGALERFAAKGAPSPLPRPQRQALWSVDPDLKALDLSLAAAVDDLHAISVIWTINIVGECVAASNASSNESFVGTNYSDRQYFQEAMAGKLGHQYAVGRNTNIPGLFFSAPVTVEGRIVGVVATKIDLPYLLSWVNQASAFVSDNFGVIVLAQDKRLEMSVLPNATISTLSPDERMTRYRQSDFATMDFSAWPDSSYPDVRRIAGTESPVLMRSVDIPGEDLAVTVMRPVPVVADVGQDRASLFAIFTFAAAAAIVCLLYFAAIQNNRKLARAEQNSRELAEDLKRRIDERASIEAIRQASEVRLRAITDSLVECVVVADRHGRVVFANRSSCLLFNYSIDQCLFVE